MITTCPRCGGAGLVQTKMRYSILVTTCHACGGVGKVDVTNDPDVVGDPKPAALKIRPLPDRRG